MFLSFKVIYECQENIQVLQKNAKNGSSAAAKINVAKYRQKQLKTFDLIHCTRTSRGKIDK